MRAAVCQFGATADVAQNIAEAESLLRTARAQGAEWAVLPENFAFVRGAADRPAPFAERVARPGPLIARFQALARELRLHVLLGTVPEQSPASPRVYGTSVLIDATGRVAAHYRKRHLFDVTLPDGQVHRESRWLLPGDCVSVQAIGELHVGFAICYDLRFPEHFRSLVQRGAHCFAVPAAFTATTGAAHWHTLLRARAIENLCYVVAANQTGGVIPGRETYGHSCIIDPWGQVLVDAGIAPGVAVADLDLATVERLRRVFPVLRHRRPMPPAAAATPR